MRLFYANSCDIQICILCDSCYKVDVLHWLMPGAGLGGGWGVGMGSQCLIGTEF